MKKSVTWSNVSVIITVVVMCILVCGMIFSRDKQPEYTVFAVMIALVIIVMWYYSPVSVTVDDRVVVVKKRISVKTIPISSIESVAPFTPSPWVNQRMCGSAGFAGYWGWFADSDIGRYFGYFGQTSDCFLLQLKNGRRYVLGCDDSPSVVSYISDRIVK